VATNPVRVKVSLDKLSKQAAKRHLSSDKKFQVLLHYIEDVIMGSFPNPRSHLMVGWDDGIQFFSQLDSLVVSVPGRFSPDDGTGTFLEYLRRRVRQNVRQERTEEETLGMDGNGGNQVIRIQENLSTKN